MCVSVCTVSNKFLINCLISIKRDVDVMLWEVIYCNNFQCHTINKSNMAVLRVTLGSFRAES